MLNVQYNLEPKQDGQTVSLLFGLKPKDMVLVQSHKYSAPRLITNAISKLQTYLLLRAVAPHAPNTELNS